MENLFGLVVTDSGLRFGKNILLSLEKVVHFQFLDARSAKVITNA